MLKIKFHLSQRMNIRDTLRFSKKSLNWKRKKNITNQVQRQKVRLMKRIRNLSRRTALSTNWWESLCTLERPTLATTGLSSTLREVQRREVKTQSQRPGVRRTLSGGWSSTIRLYETSRCQNLRRSAMVETVQVARVASCSLALTAGVSAVTMENLAICFSTKDARRSLSQLSSKKVRQPQTTSLT